MSIQTKKQQRVQSSNELVRLYGLFRFEREARINGFQNLCGIDEAGRGPLAGPVVAACCVIDEEALIHGVDDSKKLTSEKREELFQELTSNPGITYGIGVVSSEEIDRVNILQATKQAMFLALDQLATLPDLLLVDGMALHYKEIPFQKIIHGDALSYSIAAASILAKVTRDRLMLKYHETWPEYGFDQHKGYGTAKHLEAIEKYGPCPIHRLTFAPVKNYEKVPG